METKLTREELIAELEKMKHRHKYFISEKHKGKWQHKYFKKCIYCKKPKVAFI